jgi:hypothetical protein
LSPPYRPLAIFLDTGRRTLHGARLFATHEGAIGAFGEEVDSYRRARRRRIRRLRRVTLVAKSARPSGCNMAMHDNHVRARLRTRYVS